MSTRAYTVVFERDEEGGFVVTVPALRGVVSYGYTMEEARAMAKEAIECFIEGLRNEGLPVPEEGSTTAMIENVSVDVA